jgi:hypothetical protein
MKKLRYILALVLSLGLVLAPVSTAHAGLESGTYVSDLNTSNPVNGDPVSQGAAHLRLIKTVLQATFPNGDAPIYGFRSETAKNLTGTSVDFTDIPSWVKRITITIGGMSTNGTARPMLRLGDSGGIETSGYSGLLAASSGATVDNTTGFYVAEAVAAATTLTGRIVLDLHNTANAWIATINVVSSGGTLHTGGGAKVLTDTLDRIRFTTANGTDTFDAGTVNIHYE